MRSPRCCAARRGAFGVAGLLLIFAHVGILVDRSFADDPEASGRRLSYVRDAEAPGEALQRVLDAGAPDVVADVVLVFDTITFRSPLGRNEFTSRYAYEDDVPAWLDAIESHTVDDGPRLWVTTTTMKGLVSALDPGWRAALTKTLESRWWEEADFRRIPALHVWLAKVGTRVR